MTNRFPDRQSLTDLGSSFCGRNRYPKPPNSDIDVVNTELVKANTNPSVLDRPTSAKMATAEPSRSPMPPIDVGIMMMIINKGTNKNRNAMGTSIAAAWAMAINDSTRTIWSRNDRDKQAANAGR